ncbi:peptidoglycan hydrolase-like protein with peptidoglycan-binding domain/prefoldin subunit 5 [Paenibacillus sp. DS2015]|uniref:peptidoglycan-binding domain-containing protein n=1 Tax=Paenibacillus sp. DS2015 TaxID=3373917 RepID=UPI003D1A3507
MMKQKVDTKQITELAGGMRRLDLVIEDAGMIRMNEISKLVSDTRDEYYSERSVQSAVEDVDRLIREIQALSRSLHEQLDQKQKTLDWVANEYVIREMEAKKMLEVMIPLPWNVTSPFSGSTSEGNSKSWTDPRQLFFSFAPPNFFLPITVKPLSSNLSLNPSEYSDDTKQLQQRLKELGYTIEVDGYFNEQTLEAVNTYKDRYKLGNEGKDKGIVGEQTWRYLFGTLSGELGLDSTQTSEQVRMAQIRLSELGFDVEATGYLDETTIRAVNGFKEINELDNSGRWEGVIGPQTWKALFNIQTPPPPVVDPHQAVLKAVDPYQSVSLEDILNRDDPEVQERLKNTYWATLSEEEQDKRYEEIKEDIDREDKAYADKMRRLKSGIGNQFIANLFEGGSNAFVNAINTSTAGIAEIIVESIMGPQPAHYNDPLDNEYGKGLGEIVGQVIGFALPFKYLKGIPSLKILDKLTATMVASVTAETIFSTVTQVSDAITDFKKDGDQSLVTRGVTIAENAALAAAGDLLLTYVGRGVVSAIQRITGKNLSELLKGPNKVDDIVEGAEPKPLDVPAPVDPLKGTGNLVSKYLDDIVDAAGNINHTKMNNLKNAIQNNTFNADELSQISKKMTDLRITSEFHEVLLKIDFGKYLKGRIGDPPVNMLNPHAHHTLFKKGLGEAQQKLVQEGQEILRKYNIDPIIGVENLVWAPNRISGQHSIEALENVVNQLKAVDAAGGDLDDFVEILADLGKLAASRR